MTDVKIVKYSRCPQKMISMNYFGLELEIEDYFHWLAIDDGGSVYKFCNKPWLNVIHSHWETGRLAVYIGTVKFEGDWAESLMEVKNV